MMPIIASSSSTESIGLQWPRSYYPEYTSNIEKEYTPSHSDLTVQSKGTGKIDTETQTPPLIYSRQLIERRPIPKTPTQGFATPIPSAPSTPHSVASTTGESHNASPSPITSHSVIVDEHQDSSDEGKSNSSSHIIITDKMVSSKDHSPQLSLEQIYPPQEKSNSSPSHASVQEKKGQSQQQSEDNMSHDMLATCTVTSGTSIVGTIDQEVQTDPINPLEGFHLTSMRGSTPAALPYVDLFDSRKDGHQILGHRQFAYLVPPTPIYEDIKKGKTLKHAIQPAKNVFSLDQQRKILRNPQAYKFQQANLLEEKESKPPDVDEFVTRDGTKLQKAFPKLKSEKSQLGYVPGHEFYALPATYFHPESQEEFQLDNHLIIAPAGYHIIKANEPSENSEVEEKDHKQGSFRKANFALPCEDDAGSASCSADVIEGAYIKTSYQYMPSRFQVFDPEFLKEYGLVREPQGSSHKGQMDQESVIQNPAPEKVKSIKKLNNSQKIPPPEPKHIKCYKCYHDKITGKKECKNVSTPDKSNDNSDENQTKTASPSKIKSRYPVVPRTYWKYKCRPLQLCQRAVPDIYKKDPIGNRKKLEDILEEEPTMTTLSSTKESSLQKSGTYTLMKTKNQKDENHPGTVIAPVPSPFLSPRKRFEAGLKQLTSSHNPDFMPPMPRPPLFSQW